ncbi:unnamed protein product [Protopolystoma xenopodis]|uniref:Mannosyltransferase n=1 Tax=Protopolystoma xenopodis TaxID=117903 RepID=A0A3S5BY40_9PLAT|nr:unnamed protein product [Protopolystoma xenopodis]
MVALFSLCAITLLKPISNQSGLFLSSPTSISLPNIICLLLLQAFIFVWSCFLRPEAPSFLFTVILLELSFFLRQFPLFKASRFLCRPGILFIFLFVGLVGLCLSSCLFILMDTLYFLHSTNSSIFNLLIEHKSSKFVVTPVNFLSYNLDPENLAHHGRHSWFIHLFVNLPLMLSPCLLALIFLPPMVWSYRDTIETSISASDTTASVNPIITTQMVDYYLLSSFLIPVTMLSSLTHQEPRFLVPSIPFAILLAARRILYITPTYENVSMIRQEYCSPVTSTLAKHLNPRRKFETIRGGWRRILICASLVGWFLQQSVLVVFFGQLHQGGLQV